MILCAYSYLNKLYFNLKPCHNILIFNITWKKPWLMTRHSIKKHQPKSPQTLYRGKTNTIYPICMMMAVMQQFCCMVDTRWHLVWHIASASEYTLGKVEWIAHVQLPPPAQLCMHLPFKNFHSCCKENDCTQTKPEGYGSCRLYRSTFLSTRLKTVRRVVLEGVRILREAFSGPKSTRCKVWRTLRQWPSC